MPFFAIRRNVPGLAQEDIDAASFRAITCAFEYPGLRWISSQWDGVSGVIDCLYEGESEHQIREHSERSRIPCDEVRVVVVVRPGDYGAGGRDEHMIRSQEESRSAVAPTPSSER